MQERELAVTLCSAAACEPNDYKRLSHSQIAQGFVTVDFGNLPNAVKLAMAAWAYVEKRLNGRLEDFYAICDAEAEALIRTGWLPK